MAALSMSQAHLFGNVSRPSVEFSSKHQSASAPRKLYTWISAKRKRDDEDLEEKCDLSPRPAPFKRVEHYDTPDSYVEEANWLQPQLCVPHARRPVSAAKVNAALHPSQGPRSTTKTDSARPEPKLSLVFYNLPQSVRTLITLHKYFLKALAIHFAHNGAHAPAELGRLLETITRLWKERSVTLADIQRMFAIDEIGAKVRPCEGKEIARSLSPFKLVMAGSCISIEYVGQRKEAGGSISTLFNEKDLHDAYRTHIYTLDSTWAKERHAHLSFFDEDSLDDFPKLACDIGTQTAARKAHISQQLTEIKPLPNSTQIRNANAPKATGEKSADETLNPKRRNENLSDRINARHLASQAHGKPTPQQVLRKHALGRIKEVTEILRMMQQQHKGEPKSTTHAHSLNEFNSGNRSGKVSFSLTRLLGNIKSSVRIPISDGEVTMCLKMLSKELEGTWVKIIERKGTSTVTFVVVEGEGMSGKEAQRRLTEKQI